MGIYTASDIAWYFGVISSTMRRPVKINGCELGGYAILLQCVAWRRFRTPTPKAIYISEKNQISDGLITLESARGYTAGRISPVIGFSKWPFIGLILEIRKI